jgi:mono/diheme cytochrome c family protein
MDFQPKAKPQTASDIFPDGRAARISVAGTVARGELKTDSHFYRGLVGNEWATTFPEPNRQEGWGGTTAETMARGKQRFEIYCSPCHGYTGEGTGMINKRADKVGATATGWVAPSNITQPAFARQPHGQLFNTITHGIRSMPGYGAQIKEADRWAIVFYLRALQRSAHATVDDVPAGSQKAIR